MTRSAFAATSILALVAGVLLAQGVYSYAEAQGAADKAAELDAGVAAAPVDASPPVAREAQTPALAEPDPVVTATEIAEDVEGGNWREVAAGALVLAMFALRRARDHERSPFRGKRGGAILVMLLGLGTAFAGVLATDVPLTWQLIVGTVAAVWTAVGGYHWAKDVLPAKQPIAGDA